jgi:ribosomal-protein-alanine N-acetyltransferase
MDFAAWVKDLRKRARAGTGQSFVIELDGQIVGQISVANITRGSVCSAALGYWISEHVAGRGVMPLAVALAVDHCFATLGLHRVEVNVMPHNERSLRVVTKLGFRDEGVRERYMHIGGEWRDHRTFALTAEEVGDGLVARMGVSTT